MLRLAQLALSAPARRTVSGHSCGTPEARGRATAGPTADRRFQAVSSAQLLRLQEAPGSALLRCAAASVLAHREALRRRSCWLCSGGPAEEARRFVRSGSPPPLEDGARRSSCAAELRCRAGRAAAAAGRRLAQRRPLRRDVRLPRRRSVQGGPRGLPLQADDADEGRGGVPRLLQRRWLRRLRLPELRQGLRERHQAVLVAHGQLLQHVIRVGQRDVLPAADQEAVQPVG